MILEYNTGRDNLALTIMVPYDCLNNCPFCTSKESYSKIRPDLLRVIKTTKEFFAKNHTLYVEDVVISGGEPMADIDGLKMILEAIPRNMRVFINTSLVKQGFDELCEIVNNDERIKGINVSRHGTTYEEDCIMLCDIVRETEFVHIKKPIRINCVWQLCTNRMQRIIDLLHRWENIPNVELSIREDYNNMTDSNLHAPYYSILPILASYCGYVRTTFCEVCDTVCFEYGNRLSVRYHRGLKYTSHGTYIKHVNDVIIRQDGEVFFDWDMSEKSRLPLDQLIGCCVMPMNAAETVTIRKESPLCIYGSVGGLCGGRGGC